MKFHMVELCLSPCKTRQRHIVCGCPVAGPVVSNRGGCFQNTVNYNLQCKNAVCTPRSNIDQHSAVVAFSKYDSFTFKSIYWCKRTTTV